MKRTLPVIDFQEVRLRPLLQTDLPMTLEWRNGERTRIWFKHSEILTIEAHRAWFERYAVRDDEFMFIIERRSTGGPIGQVGLYGLDLQKNETEGGRLMAAPQGVTSGLMTQAVKAICDWGLRCLCIERVTCEVFRDNTACLRAIRLAGFKVVAEHDRMVLLDLPRAVGLRAESCFAETA